MKLALSTRLSRVLFSAVIFLVALPLAFFSSKFWLASDWNSSANPVAWRKAAALEPSDAQYWEHLARYEQWSMAHGDPRESIRDFQRATADDPWSSSLWSQLAGAYQASGDFPRAQAAFERAESDQPLSSDLAWRYGSFLLFENKPAQGFAEIRRAVTSDPSLVSSAISECWQADPHVSALLGGVLPARRGDYFAAIAFLLSEQRMAQALEVWQRLLALHQPIALAAALPLIDSLIAQNRLPQAQQAWTQALDASHWPRDRASDASLVFNGGFEHKIANGGFDWREVSTGDVRLNFESRTAHPGSRSLRIEFEGKANLDFQNVFQYVAVQPRTQYHFSAYVRTDGISTRSGIRFAIFDPAHPAELEILTPSMTGTNPWTRVESDFTTGKDTDLIEIAIRRTPEWRFDNKIRGTAWVDDVALAPIRAQTEGSGR